MGITLRGGSVGQRGVGSSTRDFEIWFKGSLEVESLSLSLSLSLCLCLFGSSVKGTWREGSPAGDPDKYLEKALVTGISLLTSSIWGTWRRAHLPGTLRCGLKGGSGTGVPLSMGALFREPGGGASFFRGPRRLWKEGSGDGYLSSWGLSWATWSGLLYWGL
jgi:hypothetical protein